MDRTMCPGQDTRYWRPDDIFNVPCASCGESIEFFKDDAARRCARCGARVHNPRLSTGCAQWCKHAKECLGYDPAGMAGSDTASAPSIANDIIGAMEKEFGGEGTIVTTARAAFEEAMVLMERRSVKPGVVIPAVLLLRVDTGTGSGRTAHAERIMKEAGMERSDIEDACAIIRAYNSGTVIDSPESKIVAESYAGHARD